jgi:hypothetical protein
MKHVIFVMSVVLALASLDACGGSAPAGAGGSGGGGTAGSGGISASSESMGTGGMVGSGGISASGGSTGSGGRTGTGGQARGGATGAGGQTGLCPYTVDTFSCDAACKKLHDFSPRCETDPTVPAELQAMFGLYGQVEIICTSTCALVAPTSQAQWACFQGVPDDAPCSAIAGCSATNCP